MIILIVFLLAISLSTGVVHLIFTILGFDFDSSYYLAALVLVIGVLAISALVLSIDAIEDYFDPPGYIRDQRKRKKEERKKLKRKYEKDLRDND